MIYKFYIPASNRYVEFDTTHSITVNSIFEEDGTQIPIMYQNGESPLEVHELISYGQIIEAYKQFKRGQREYDSYAIFSEEMKKYAMEKRK